jgi:hypothetical protein
MYAVLPDEDAAAIKTILRNHANKQIAAVSKHFSDRDSGCGASGVL